MRDFKIDKVKVYGIDKAIIASGNAMRTVMEDNDLTYSENDLIRSKKLGRAKSGEGHDTFLRGITVYLDIHAPLYMWKQIQRYHWFEFISSQSTMHRITKFNIEDQCNKYVWYKLIDYLNDLIKYYNDEMYADEKEKKDIWYQIISNVPCGFILGATMVTNYQQLKTMYFQRRNHKLIEWREFCKWCETLPLFKELIMPDDSEIRHER